MAERTEGGVTADLAGAEEAAAAEAAVEVSGTGAAALTSADGDSGTARKSSRRARTAQVADGAAGLDDADAASYAGPEPVADTSLATPAPVSGSGPTVVEGGASEVVATTVQVSRGGIGRASARDVNVSMGGIGLARADRVTVELGGIGAAIAGEVEVRQGGVNAIIAREVEVEQAIVQSIVAGSAEVEEGANVFILIAGRVTGDVRPALDWRGGLALGAAFGLVVGLLRRWRA